MKEQQLLEPFQFAANNREKQIESPISNGEAVIVRGMNVAKFWFIFAFLVACGADSGVDSGFPCPLGSTADGERCQCDIGTYGEYLWEEGAGEEGTGGV